MRGLKIAMAVMGVLIIGGFAALAWIVAGRLSGAQNAVSTLLDEPAGTRIAEIGAVGERLALRLEGGGRDRVVLIDPRSGRMIGKVGLAR